MIRRIGRDRRVVLLELLSRLADSEDSRHALGKR
jgi:hypothetical protein